MVVGGWVALSLVRQPSHDSHDSRSSSPSVDMPPDISSDVRGSLDLPVLPLRAQSSFLRSLGALDAASAAELINARLDPPQPSGRSARSVAAAALTLVPRVVRQIYAGPSALSRLLCLGTSSAMGRLAARGRYFVASAPHARAAKVG